EAETEFLQTLLPELKFQIDVDPLDLQADVAWARLPGPPPELAQRLADWRCRGVHAEFTLVGEKPDDIMFRYDTVGPFICKSTWPAEVPERLYRLNPRPKSINVTYTTPFTVTNAGEYRFALETYAGSGTLTIDGLRRDASAHTTVPLSAG